jgi:CheY-like chemotaxis protein
MSGDFAETRVLLVEDETLVALMIEDMIDDIGAMRVGTASTVGEAMTALESARPDIAVLDVNVGGDQVFPVCERLAELGIPFVFSTGYGAHGVPPQWRANPVLQKPYTAPQLADALARCLD